MRDAAEIPNGVHTVELAGRASQAVAYAEQGVGDDTVFLFHGVTANHRVWGPVQRVLAASARVIAVDQRGHGRSGKPASGYTADDYANDIGALVEALGGRGRNVLVGHSLGSRNSIVAGERFPGLIDGVVAIDFTPFIETEVFDTLAARVGSGDKTFGSVTEIEAYLQQRYPLMPRDAVARRAAYGYVEETGVLRPLASPEAMQQTVAGLRADLSESYSRLTVPTVVVRGAESALVTETAFERSRALRPDFSYETVAGADHYVPEEQPEAIAGIVSALIDRLPQNHH